MVSARLILILLIGAILIAGTMASLLLNQQRRAKLLALDRTLEEQACDVTRLRAENKELASLAAFARQEPANRRDELTKLRSEVEALRKQTNSWAALRQEQRKLQLEIAKARVNPNSPVIQPEGLMEETKAKLSKEHIVSPEER